MRVGCQSDKEIANKQSASFNYGECGQFSGAIRILNQEVNKLLDEDSGYKHVYWFMLSFLYKTKTLVLVLPVQLLDDENE